METMLAWFRERTAPWTERLPMRKEAATAAVSTECGFPNGAAELWTRGRERSGDSLARLNCGRAEGKEAATAAVSTECGFPNGAAELWMEKIWNYQNV